MKKICITGASRGIGLAEALKLQQQNELFLLASSVDSFPKDRLEKCHLFGYDLSSIQSIRQFANDIEQKTTSLDILINNVGIIFMKQFVNMNDKEIEQLVDVNLTANILVTKKLLPLLLKSPEPHIVFMSSMAAKSSLVGESVYAATKAGITNFANVLRNELAGKVRISTIHSWGVDTWGVSKDANVLKPENVVEALDFIITRERPFLIESIDLGHEKQWRGGEAPWSPKE